MGSEIWFFVILFIYFTLRFGGGGVKHSDIGLGIWRNSVLVSTVYGLGWEGTRSSIVWGHCRE